MVDDENAIYVIMNRVGRMGFTRPSMKGKRMQMISFQRSLSISLLAAFFMLLPIHLHAQRISDIKVRYSRLSIKEATLEKVGTLDVDFYRHNFDVEVGVGQAFVGLTYQYATKKKNTTKLGNTFGTTEDGMMLTAGYNYIFSNKLRLDTYGRLRIWGDTNSAQALYATETDIRLNLIMFDLDGLAIISNKAVFPSYQVGMNVNKFGRVQGIAGAGLWWNGIGVYLTGFKAFNGVNEALNPGKDADKIFANLKNAGLTFGMTYEFHEFLVWLRQNYAFKNGGHDLTLSLQYQHFFPGRRRSDNKL